MPAALGLNWDHYHYWKEQGLTEHEIKAMVKFLLGGFNNTRVATSRTAPGWPGVPVPFRKSQLQCPCGKGKQDAYHLWKECQYMPILLTEFWSSVVGKAHHSVQGLLTSLQGDPVASAHQLLHPNSFQDTTHHRQFKLAAIRQLLSTLQLFDDALLPTRTTLKNNARMFSKCMQLSVQVEDCQFAQCEVLCDDSSVF